MQVDYHEGVEKVQGMGLVNDINAFSDGARKSCQDYVRLKLMSGKRIKIIDCLQ